MALHTDVINGTSRALRTTLNIRRSDRVPDKRDLRFLTGDGAVLIDATYVYADLADSSKLAQGIRPDIVANIIRAYLNACVRIFRDHGGAIRSFDGDRVMAIFVGLDKNRKAARAAMVLNWAVEEVINPQMVEIWPDIKSRWRMKHGVGIATGEALVVRGGVFGDDGDMVSVGAAPNIAAKLSDIRPSHFGPQYALYITEEVYQDLDDELRLGPPPSLGPLDFAYFPQTQQVDMWQGLGQHDIGGSKVFVRGSTYMMRLP